MVKVSEHNKPRRPSAVDNVHRLAGVERELLEAHMNVMRNEMRLWLLKSLLEKDLATRDIYYFTKKQALLRYTDKIPDKETMRVAMEVKIRDMRKVLSHSYNIRRTTNKSLLSELNYRSKRLVKKVNKIKDIVAKEKLKISTKYKAKIEHYHKLQAPDGLISSNCHTTRKVTPTEESKI